MGTFDIVSVQFQRHCRWVIMVSLSQQKMTLIRLMKAEGKQAEEGGEWQRLDEADGRILGPRS